MFSLECLQDGPAINRFGTAMEQSCCRITSSAARWANRRSEHLISEFFQKDLERKNRRPPPTESLVDHDLQASPTLARLYPNGSVWRTTVNGAGGDPVRQSACRSVGRAPRTGGHDGRCTGRGRRPPSSNRPPRRDRGRTVPCAARPRRPSPPCASMGGPTRWVLTGDPRPARDVWVLASVW